jgi:hypothetical protein
MPDIQSGALERVPFSIIFQLPGILAGRLPFRPCRVAARQTSTRHPQSRPQACSQPARRRAFHRRFVHPFHEPGSVLRSAIVLKPSTLLHLHHMLAKRRYRMLFSRKRRRPPGPKGPNKELIDAVVALKRLASIFRSRASLGLENLALRHQIGVLQRSAGKRPKLTSGDRLLWICRSRRWRDCRSALAIVKPETVVAWHRAAFRLFCTWKVRCPPLRRPSH